MQDLENPEEIETLSSSIEDEYIIDDLLSEDLDGIVFSAENIGYGLTTGQRFSEFLKEEEEKTLKRIRINYDASNV